VPDRSKKGQPCRHRISGGSGPGDDQLPRNREVEGKGPLARFGYGAARRKREDVAAEGTAGCGSTADLLDFALAFRRAADRQKRGGLRPSATGSAGRVQRICSTDGRPLELGIVRVSGEVRLQPRVTYNTNTEAGSAGSPAFLTRIAEWSLTSLWIEGARKTRDPYLRSGELAEKGLVTRLTQLARQGCWISGWRRSRLRAIWSGLFRSSLG